MTPNQKSLDLLSGLARFITLSRPTRDLWANPGPPGGSWGSRRDPPLDPAEIWPRAPGGKAPAAAATWRPSLPSYESPRCKDAGNRFLLPADGAPSSASPISKTHPKSLFPISVPTEIQIFLCVLIDYCHF